MESHCGAKWDLLGNHGDAVDNGGSMDVKCRQLGAPVGFKGIPWDPGGSTGWTARPFLLVIVATP